MLHNPALSKLANALLQTIPFISLPNNPRNKKAAKKPFFYLFTSTQVVEKKDGNGVVHQVLVGRSCKRGVAKAPSKRDLHRQKQEQ